MPSRTAALVRVALPAGALAALAVAADCRAAPAPAPAPTVVLARGLDDADVVAVSVAAASAGPDVHFLLDSPRAEGTIRPFLERLRPSRLLPVGAFPDGHDPARRWGVDAAAVAPVAADPVAFAWSLGPKSGTAVVAPRQPADQLLQAACLAGVLRAPLFVLRDGPDPLAGFRDLAAGKGVKEVIAVGTAGPLVKRLRGFKLHQLADTPAVTHAHRRELLKAGTIDALVLANPADLKRMAALAPWLAVKRRAALLLTATDGKDAGAVVAAALRDRDTAAADSLIVAAGLEAVPVTKRVNPAAGRDEFIDVEPWAPDGDDLNTLAAGRLFHADRAVVPVVLAREALLARSSGPPRALVASNPGGGLPLLETFSRNTVRELTNAGYQVTARYEDDVEPKEIRDLLPRSDIFLWEGHYRTLIDKFEMPTWTENLPPSLIFLQSCLALNQEEAGLLFDRGAVAVVGSPNRTYSGSGGAFTLAYFDALSYDGRTLGGAMRHAKNFLLCYSDLKTKRLGEGAKLNGANRRASWAFTLWGDPTVALPRPTPPADALPPLTAEGTKTTITLTLPEKRYPPTDRPPYRAEMWPGGRLAGLITTNADDTKKLAPLAFAEVSLPGGPKGQVPHLSSKLPKANYVFRWDDRRKVGHLLVLPRAKDGGEVQFRVHWAPPGDPADEP